MRRRLSMITNSVKDYLRDFRNVQTSVDPDQYANMHCVNSYDGFRDCFMKHIQKDEWNNIKIVHLDKDEYHDILIALNVFVLKKLESYGIGSINNIRDKAYELFRQKNHDYGNSFETFGTVGILIRIMDKLNRITTLEDQKERKVKDESIKDTLEDLYNYTILGIIV